MSDKLQRLAVIIPIYQESTEDLDSLFEWISEQNSDSTTWHLAVAFEEKSHYFLYNSKFNSSGMLTEKLTVAKNQPIQLDPSLFIVYSEKGRGRQMNTGADQTEAQTLLFHHADTRLESGWYKEYREFKEYKEFKELSNQNENSWGCFKPAISDDGIVFRLAENWGYIRSKYLGLPYGDQSIFVDKSLFQRAGKYDEKTEFMEDLQLAQSLTRLAGKPAIMSTKALTSSRLWRREKNSNSVAIALRSFKNIVAFLAFVLGVSRDSIKDWYQR